jgi:hypothetical protein
MSVPASAAAAPSSKGDARALGQLARELAGLWQLLPGHADAQPQPAADGRR